MISEIECITFDLDDTLWPVAPTIGAAEAALYEWLQQVCPRITETYSLEDLTEKRNNLKTRRQEIAHNVTALRLESLREIAKEFDCSADLAVEGLQLFRMHRNRVTPFDDIEPTLAILQRFLTVGAITNGNAELNTIPIGRFFDFVVTAEDAGVSKPDPQIFYRAAKNAGTQTDKLVHVGDCANADVLGALHAGCKSIWLNANRKPWPGGQNPHAVIHKISELPEVLEIC